MIKGQLKMLRLAWLIVFAGMTFVQQASAEDDLIKSELLSSKQVYKNEVAGAHDALVNLLNSKEADAQRSGDLQMLEKVRSEKLVFESNDELPKLVQTRTYTEAIKRARKKMADAYLAAQKEYTKAGKIDFARDVNKELEEFGNADSLETKRGGQKKIGDSIDLLRLVDPDIDFVRGHWIRKGESLVSPSPVENEGRIGIPVTPNGDYELHVRFTRLRGPHGPGLTLPVGSRQVNVVIGNVGKFSGLQELDGMYFRDDKNPTRAPGTRLDDNREHNLVARVTSINPETATIKVTLDEKQLINWTGRPSQLSMDSNWKLQDDHIFGLHAWETVFRFDEVRLEMVSGDAKRPWAKQK